MENEPEDKEIPELCKQTFVSTRQGLTILWVIAGLVISGVTVAVGWSMSMERDVTEIKVVQRQLQEQVNDKLDFIKRKLEEK